jgi:KDO2-lipid IV(A) lauroyltransferase
MQPPANPALPAGAEASIARPRWYSHGLNRLIFYRIAAISASAAPRTIRLPVARAIGRAIGLYLTEERAHVQSNLARVLPEASPAALNAAVGETFANFAAYFADLLTLNRRDPAALLRYVSRVDGREHLDAAFAAQRGAILLTAHLGNWELGGRILAHRGGRITHVVVWAEADADLERYLRVDSPQLRFVTRRQATASIGLLAALRRDELVAMQGDRAAGGRGDIPVPFFGAPAAFPIGPFLLARVSGAPVVPAFCTMVPGGRYRIMIEPPIWVTPGEERTGLGKMVEVLERTIRAFPTQWFNFFDVRGLPRAAS